VSTPFTLSVPYQIDTLDPHAKDRLGNVAIASHFYDALVTLDPEMAIKPRLAEHWETPDPLTWILHLRGGVRFQDGRLLTADDVVFSFDRLRRQRELECGVYAAQVVSVARSTPGRWSSGREAGGVPSQQARQRVHRAARRRRPLEDRERNRPLPALGSAPGWIG